MYVAGKSRLDSGIHLTEYTMAIYPSTYGCLLKFWCLFCAWRIWECRRLFTSPPHPIEVIFFVQQHPTWCHLQKVSAQFMHWGLRLAGLQQEIETTKMYIFGFTYFTPPINVKPAKLWRNYKYCPDKNNIRYGSRVNYHISANNGDIVKSCFM